MREPAADAEVFGLLAEFDKAEDLLESVKRARRAGYRSLETYTPFPLDGLGEAIGFKSNAVAIVTLVGTILGFLGIFGLQYFTNWRYSIEIGGRPLYTWPAFLVIAFEVTLLCAAIMAAGSMLLLNRLPRLHYPLFDNKNFHFMSADKFFLVIFSNDEKFDERRTRIFLERLQPQRVDLVTHSEEAE